MAQWHYTSSRLWAYGSRLYDSRGNDKSGECIAWWGASAILDDLVGATVFALGREYAYTSINLTVDFLHAAQLGDTVTVTAEVVRAGKNIIHCEGRIVAADGKIIAKCSTNLIQTSVKLGF
ncbi:PaaI family thioesterase [Spirosoma telluris]|uniref:PaaI family thioesterase n=1 Tax=Spirosoma telluris TaxID=2183553 RepID=UPI002FC31D8E